MHSAWFNSVVGALEMLRKREIVALLLVLSLAGCTGWPKFSEFNQGHSWVQGGSGDYAVIYFLRPDTERYMGAADNRIAVELNKELLLYLVKSEYTVVHLKPGEVDVTIKSLTNAGPFREFKQMKHTKRFEFAVGSTYYLSIEPVDGEFRGVYFQPHMIDLASAQQKSRHMRAIGPANRKPIAQMSGG